jgi:leucyl aminopeptidase
LFYFFVFMTHFSLETEILSTDLVCIPVFSDLGIKNSISSLSGIPEEILFSFLETEDFEGKFLQSQFLYTSEKNIPRIFVIGLGKAEDFSIRKWKQVLGAAVISAQSKKIQNIQIVIPEYLQKTKFEQTLKSAVVAVELASYSYDIHRQKDAQVITIESCTFLSSSKQNPKEIKKILEEGVIMGESINWVRTLGNTPPSIMTPEFLAKEAQQLEEKENKVTVKILSQKEIEKLKMGCLLGVSKGSIHDAKFIIAEYFGGKKSEAPTVFVGKGITFDSGGLSLKPGDFMVDMKFDMLGGATVLGILRAASELKLKRNIVALIPTCENMPSGNAYRPDDILTAMNGLNVLVENTDAEGRLILADALCYAARYNPREVIDFATLTGACLVALGNERSGLFSDVDDLVEDIEEASLEVGEQLWRLPVGEEYTEAVKSEVADLKNLGGVGGSRFAGASTAAAFLQCFTQDLESGESLYPWAHIDLSCSYYGGKGKAWIRGGANGFGVETMIEYLST